MAQDSRLDPILCLRWKMERPYAGGWRQSPTFIFARDEFKIVIKLGKITNKQSKCEIYLHRDYFRTMPGFSLYVDCHLIVRDKLFHDRSHVDPNNSQEKRILIKDIDEDEIKPSGSVEEWTVLCMFNCSSDPFSLQVKDKTISCSVNNKENDDKCVQVCSEIFPDMEALSSDISSLLEEDMLPDFELKCGGRSFPVHQSILAARSEVFRAMFRSGMLESETRSSDIKDLEASDLESLLKFFYSGQLGELSEDTAASLYETADKYAVPSLRKACSYWMERNLSEDNCVGYLSIADSHADPDLTAGIVSFIVKHPAVLKSAAWLTFSEQLPALANKILQTYISSAIP